MKNYIEALIAREKTRLDQAAKMQNATTDQIATLRKLNQDLIQEVSDRSEKIHFLDKMLKEETENA